jgi:hypothetical protein
MSPHGMEDWHGADDPQVRDIRSASGTSDDGRFDVEQACASLVERLRRRKVVQWTLAYLAMGWMILQLMDILGEIWSWSIVLQQVVSLVLGFGILPTLIVAWYHGEKGRQEICPLEAALMAATVMGAAFAIWTISMELMGC